MPTMTTGLEALGDNRIGSMRFEPTRFLNRCSGRENDWIPGSQPCQQLR